MYSQETNNSDHNNFDDCQSITSISSNTTRKVNNLSSTTMNNSDKPNNKTFIHSCKAGQYSKEELLEQTKQLDEELLEKGKQFLEKEKQFLEEKKQILERKNQLHELLQKEKKKQLHKELLAMQEPIQETMEPIMVNQDAARFPHDTVAAVQEQNQPPACVQDVHEDDSVGVDILYNPCSLSYSKSDGLRGLALLQHENCDCGMLSAMTNALIRSIKDFIGRSRSHHERLVLIDAADPTIVNPSFSPLPRPASMTPSNPEQNCAQSNASSTLSGSGNSDFFNENRSKVWRIFEKFWSPDSRN